jgi:hypothetical protein
MSRSLSTETLGAQSSSRAALGDRLTEALAGYTPVDLMLYKRLCSILSGELAIELSPRIAYQYGLHRHHVCQGESRLA